MANKTLMLNAQLNRLDKLATRAWAKYEDTPDVDVGLVEAHRAAWQLYELELRVQTQAYDKYLNETFTY